MSSPIGQALTDGTGVSPITWPKLLKDFVADFLLSVPAALLAAGIVDVPTDQKGVMVAVIAVGGALVKAAYRAALRWATS